MTRAQFSPGDGAGEYAGRENWMERIPQRAEVMLEEVDLFRGFFIACEREDGLPQLRVRRFAGDGRGKHRARLRSPSRRTARIRMNRVFDTGKYRYAYQSLVTPTSVFEYDVARRIQLLKQVEVPGGFDRTLYASERIYATAADGVEVPVSLV